MAVYTTLLRTICEEIAYRKYGEKVYTMPPDVVIEEARPTIFNFLYPIFDENYRPILETKIIKHFYFREIGQETPAQTLFYLSEIMLLEMPVFNKYYESATLKFNPLHDIDITTERTGEAAHERTGQDNAITTENETSEEDGTRNETATATGTATNISNSNTKQGFSDTPQGPLSQVEQNRYLTNYQYGTQSGSDTNTSNSETRANGTTKNTGTRSARGSNVTDRKENLDITDHFIETVKGKSGGANYGQLLTDYRNALINVDKMVLDALEPCFMQIF